MSPAQQKKPIPKAAVVGLTLVGCLVLVAAGYLALIMPKRHALAATKKEIAEKRAQIEEVNSKTAAAKSAPKVHVASLYQLAKAMPSQVDMPDVLLALDQIAQDTGLTFERIAPGPAVNLSGYQAVPIELKFVGNFYNIADFIYRVRNLVRVRHGELDSTGRLFAIDQIQIGDEEFPIISVQLNLDAFVYGNAAPPAAGATTSSSTDTSTTGTTASTDTTSTDTTASASAAGAAP
jgi:Tfp pilus assembly protein PilO